MTSQHLYLTGYRGSGKTTVAKVIANQLSMTSVDLDDLIETSANRSIRDIFESEGEAGFRDRETECLGELSSRMPMVVALGGGAILREVNREFISRTGKCVWLDADPKQIANRLLQDETTEARRPALTELGLIDEIQSVMAARNSLYEEASDLRVDTNGQTVETIANEIFQWLC